MKELKTSGPKAQIQLILPLSLFCIAAGSVLKAHADALSGPGQMTPSSNPQIHAPGSTVFSIVRAFVKDQLHIGIVLGFVATIVTTTFIASKVLPLAPKQSAAANDARYDLLVADFESKMRTMIALSEHRILTIVEQQNRLMRAQVKNNNNTKKIEVKKFEAKKAEVKQPSAMQKYEHAKPGQQVQGHQAQQAQAQQASQAPQGQQPQQGQPAQNQQGQQESKPQQESKQQQQQQQPTPAKQQQGQQRPSQPQQQESKPIGQQQDQQAQQQQQQQRNLKEHAPTKPSREELREMVKPPWDKAMFADKIHVQQPFVPKTCAQAPITPPPDDVAGEPPVVTREEVVNRLADGEMRNYRRLFLPGKGWIAIKRLMMEYNISDNEIEAARIRLCQPTISVEELCQGDWREPIHDPPKLVA